MAATRIPPEEAERIFADALDRFEAGAFAEAARLCRSLQASFPRNPAVLQLYALVERKRGNLDEARAKLARAVEISPGDPELLTNYGNLLAETGRHGLAIETLRSACEISPADPQLATNLVLALRGAGRAEEAGIVAAQAAPIFAGYEPLHRIRLEIAHAQGDLEGIAAAATTLTTLSPQDVRVQAALGEALLRLDRDAEALVALERWAALAPDDPLAHDTVGVALQKLGRPAAAVAAHFRALERAPADARIMTNIGLALAQAGNHAEAEALLRRAAGVPETAYGAGMSLAALRLRHHGDVAGALAIYEAVAARAPADPAARLAAGTLHLLRGDGRRGFELAEARFAGGAAVPVFARPRWQGEPLEGRTLLVWREPDLPAEIFALQPLRHAAERAGGLIVQTHPRLARLLARSVPAGVEITTEEPPALVERFGARLDMHAPAADLSRHLYRDLGAIESSPGWLTADPVRAATVRARYAAHGVQPIVGLAWRGMLDLGPGGVPPSLAQWLTLLDSPDAVFVSLESAVAAAELDAARSRAGATLVADGDLDPDGDLDDLAVRLAALDLVVGPDTPTVRLAAALGVDTWVLLPAVPNWIWFTDRADSPWSPALRLFRAAPGEGWEPALRAIALALAQRRSGG